MRETVSKILIVESEPDHREVALRVLAPCSVDTIVLANGKEASEYLFRPEAKTDRPHLVILHLTTSESNGVELLHQMRMEKSTHNIPALILVTTAEEKKVVDRFNFPLCFCFLKPLTFGKIIYALPALNMTINESVLSRLNASHDSRRSGD